MHQHGTVDRVAEGDLRRINVVQAGERTRMVLELSRAVGYDTQIEGRTVLITLAGAARLEIDLGAVARNWRQLADRAAPARCGAPVKADSVRVNVSLPSALVSSTIGIETTLSAMSPDAQLSVPTGRLALTLTDVCEVRHRTFATTGPWPGQGVLQTKRREAQVRL